MPSQDVNYNPTLDQPSKLFDAFHASSATLSWDENRILRKAQKACISWQPAPKYLYLICRKEDMGSIRKDNEDFAILLASRSPHNLTWGFEISDEPRHFPSEVYTTA